jgi:hypothetical protein
MADAPGVTLGRERLENEGGGFLFDLNDQRMHEKLEPMAIDPSSAISTAAEALALENRPPPFSA